jgi:hypothetical protein
MATLTQLPASIAAASEIPTYHQVPETSFDCKKSFFHIYRKFKED